MQNIIRLYKLIKPLIKCVQSYPKDFSLLHGILLCEVRRKHLFPLLVMFLPVVWQILLRLLTSLACLSLRSRPPVFSSFYVYYPECYLGILAHPRIGLVLGVFPPNTPAFTPYTFHFTPIG